MKPIFIINGGKTVFFTLILILSNFSLFSQQLAFPSAEGFGKYTTGGRGGIVIKVTNLNDNGVGSLRAALESSEVRTIIFEVGGTIELNSNININDGNFTLAGQTALGDGILIKGGGISVEDSNAIIRYIRIRPGPTSPADSDGLGITGWSGTTTENVIIDHCSVSWSKDENINFRGSGTGIAKNITIQHSMITEGIRGFLGDRSHNFTVYKNLFAFNGERNIRTNLSVPGEFTYEMINNIVYGYNDACRPSFGAKFTVLNNHFKLSSQINSSNSYNVEGETVGQTTPSETYSYVMGNIVPNTKEEMAPNLNDYSQTSPFESTGIIAIDASLLETEMLDNIGASFPNRDAVDNRIINLYIEGNGSLETSGTYPVIQGGTKLTDTDEDGMPDFWETENGLDLNNPSDRNFVNSDGYTNLEHYLNGIVNVSQLSAGQDKSICIGTSIVLNAFGAETYSWNTGESTASITVSPTVTTTYTVTGTNSEGEISTDSITVTVDNIPIANAGSDQTICEGEEITLTASGGSTYLWSNGATTKSITISPVTTINYSVIVSQGACSSTDEVIVTVKPRQTINAGNDVDIYLGESTTLTVVGVGNILWSTGETTPSITVSPENSTTYTVEVTAANSCTSTDEVVVTVVESFTANAGNDVAICEGENTILTASGGTAYLWNTGETTASIIVNPLSTTVYSVFVTRGTDSGTDEVTVFVDSLPDLLVSDDKTINLGEYVTLSVSGADAYQWSNGATQPNIAVSPQQTTVYSVIGFSNDCSEIAQVTVNVANTVSANAGKDMTICSGDTQTLIANGGETYLWNTGEITKSIDVTPSEDTTYTVIVSNDNASDTASVSVFVIDCGETEDPNYQYSVYPNPASDGILKIQLSGLIGISNLFIQDTVGKLIYVESFDDNNGELLQKHIDISRFSSGLYFVTLQEANKTTTKKIIFR